MTHLLGFAVFFVGALLFGLLWLWTARSFFALAAALCLVGAALEDGSQK